MFDNWTKLFATLAVIFALGLSATCQASVVFMDTFDRDTEFDLNGSMTGITNNTGNAFAGGVYDNGFVDPAYPGAGPSGGGGDGGSAKIHDNQLRLAVGAGTSNAFVNHNFINLNSKLWSVALDLTGYDGSAGSGHGGGFAVGMSQAEALSTGDAQNGDTAAGPGDFKMQDGLQDGGNQVSDVAVSDFWAVLRGDGFLQVGTNGHNFPGTNGVFGPGHLSSTNVGSNTGTIRASFFAPDFNDGTSVAYRLFFNDNLVDTGTFQWTGTNENYIGIDARHGGFVSFDNFTVSVPEPSTALLTLLATVAGIAYCRRK